MLKAVLFDMDGVLVDSEPVHFAVNRKVMKEKFNIDLEDEDNNRFVGSTVEKLWQFYIDKYGLKGYTWQDLVKLADIELDLIIEGEGLPQIAGVTEFIRDLKKRGYYLGVASSSAMKNILRNLERMGIKELFDGIVSGAELKNPKPSPDIFLMAAEGLGVKPEECVVIEDSSNGVKAAKAAGAACLGYVNPNSGNQDLSEADCLFESFLNIDEGFMRMIHNHTFGLPYKVMETEHLVIREMCIDDIDRLYEIYEPEEITKYMEPLYSDKDQERRYMKSYIDNVYKFYGYGMWIVETKDGRVIGRGGVEFVETLQKKPDEVIGCLLLRPGMAPESGHHILGYVIDRDYQRQGYGYEVCEAILRYARDVLFINNVLVKIDCNNKASMGLARKLGFIFE